MEQVINQNTTTSATAGGTQKKNTGLAVGMVACVILATSGIAFGVYGMMQSSQKDNQISDLKVQIVNRDNDDKDKTSTTTAEPSVSTYDVFSSNLANNYKGAVPGYYYHWTGSENVKRTIHADVDDDNHLKITDIDNDKKVIAEADNIISVYFIEVGNGGTPYFYMINKGGKVSRINVSEDGSRTIENLDDYNGVVSIIQGGDLYAWIIDINGNLYKTD